MVGAGRLRLADYSHARAKALGSSNWRDNFLVPLFTAVLYRRVGGYRERAEALTLIPC